LIHFVRTAELSFSDSVHCSHQAVFCRSIRIIKLQFG
jgi:hypothetical protein